MTLLFKKYYIKLILAGRKTQTRRIHKHKLKVGKTYAVKTRWFGKPLFRVVITRRFQQKLGEISLEDVKKEGYSSLEEFRRAWMRIYGSWNPEQLVTVYEFKPVSSRTGKLSSAAATRKP